MNDTLNNRQDYFPNKDEDSEQFRNLRQGNLETGEKLDATHKPPLAAITLIKS